MNGFSDISSLHYNLARTNELWMTASETRSVKKKIFSTALWIVFKDIASVKWQLAISVHALNFL